MGTVSEAFYLLPIAAIGFSMDAVPNDVQARAEALLG